MPINDPGALLKRLAQEPNESAWLEFKHNNSSPDMIGQWASACANAAILAGKERALTCSPECIHSDGESSALMADG